MSTINSLLESSASGYKNLQSDAAKMASKWGKTGAELAMILSGMATIIGSGIGFVYLQSYIARKAKEGSEKFKKIKSALDGLGSAAGGATRS